MSSNVLAPRDAWQRLLRAAQERHGVEHARRAFVRSLKPYGK